MGRGADIYINKDIAHWKGPVFIELLKPINGVLRVFSLLLLSHAYVGYLRLKSLLFSKLTPKLSLVTNFLDKEVSPAQIDRNIVFAGVFIRTTKLYSYT